MKKFKVNIPVDYMQGYIYNGHIERFYEAETEEEAIEMAIDGKPSLNHWVNIVADDYEVEDYGDPILERITAQEV